MKTCLRLINLVLLTLMVSCVILPIGKKVQVIEVAIQSNQGWQDTGVELRSGENVLIEYILGQVTDGATIIIDGSGADYICGQAECCEPLPAVRRSSLIGRVGRTDDEIFYVGNGVENTVKKNGLLFLRLNDCNSGLTDNTGEFIVRITSW